MDIPRNCSYEMETGPLHINYLEFHHCVMAGHPWISFGILCMWLLLLFYLVGHTADVYFSPTLSTLCTKLAIPYDVAGVTLLAFGNGAPDVFSSLATSTSGTMETGLNALLGGVMFVTTVVVGSVLLSSSTNTVKITPRPFCRDVLALLVTLLILFIDLPRSTSPPTSAILLLSCYTVYVLIVIVPSWISARSHPPAKVADPYAHGVLFAFWHAPELFPTKSKYGFVTLKEQQEASAKQARSGPVFQVDESYFHAPLATSSALSDPLLESPQHVSPTSPPPETPKKPHLISTTGSYVQYMLLDFLRDATIPMVLVNHWSRRQAFLSVLVCPLFVGWMIAGDEFSSDAALITLASSFPIACVVFATTYQTTAPNSRWICWLFYLLGFVSCVCWIYGLASEAVAVLTALGVLTTIPASVLGLTILSWGNSLGDLMTNVAIAKGGCPEMALAGCFGGPVFNLLVGLGLPFLFLHTSSTMPWDVHGLISLIALGASLTATLIVAIVYKFDCPKWYGKVLIALYVAYTMVHLAVVCHWI